MKYMINKWFLISNTPEQIMVILLDETGAPYNISGLTALSCKIKKADGTILSLTQSNGMAAGMWCPCWCYVFDLTADQVNSIGEGVHDVAIALEMGARKVALFYKNSLTIQSLPMDVF
jgi:hypothetical protein